MRHRMIIVTLAAVTALLAMACGDGGGGKADRLALDEYLGTIERLSDESNTRINNSSGGLQNLTADASAEELKAAFGDAYQGLLNVVDDTLAQLKEISPPAEAEDEHNEFVTAFETLQEAFSDARRGIDAASTREDLATAIAQIDSSATTQEASDRLQRACASLQKLADDNSVDVTLECGG